MRSYDYYLHRSGGKVFDHFGGIGEPYKVHWLWWYIMQSLGYRATYVIAGAPIKRVYIRALLVQGAHRSSYAMKKILDKRYGQV